MAQQKKKSLVEQTNSWRPFVSAIQDAIKARDYRKETVCAILRTLDSDVSIWPGSIFRYISGSIIGSGFLLGRRLLYEEIIRTFLKQNHHAFENAPFLVIQEFNRFLLFLFSENVAKKYFLEGSLARRKLTPEEKLQAQNRKSEEQLLNFIKQINSQKSLTSTSEKEILEKEHKNIELQFEQKKPLFTQKPHLDTRSIEILERIYAEKEADEDLLALLSTTAKSFEQFTINASIALPKTTFGVFQDIHRQLGGLPSLLYFDEEETQKLCSASPEERSLLIEKKVTQQKLPYEKLIEKASQLKADIEEIEKDLIFAKNLLEPFVKKKDTKAKVAILLSELALLNFSPSFLTEDTPTIERIVSEKKQKVTSLLTNFQTEFFELLSHIQELEMKADTIKLGILHARWEIFSRNTPFPDLSDLVDNIEKTIIETLSHSDEDLIIGEKSFTDIEKEMIESLYTHNVKLVRWELLSRALRLKDVRSEVEKELLFFDRQIGLMKLRGKVPEYLLEERAWLYSFFEKLLSPFEIFKDTSDPESINIIFRYFWVDLDRFREKKEERISILTDVGIDPEVIHAFTFMNEIMEKIAFAEPIKNLTKEIEPWLEKNDADFALLPFIAAYPYGKKEAFLHRLKKLKERKRDIEILLRAIQSAKTFEPERIDALLEAFTLLRFSKNPFESLDERYDKIERILDRIEEAAYCEIGFTDATSRMEAGYAVNELIKETKKRLPQALEMAKKRLQKTATEKNFVGTTASLLLQNVKTSQEDIFEAARAISLLFFQNRLLQAAIDPHSLARPVLLLTWNRELFYCLQKTLPKEKATKISDLFNFSRALFSLLFPQPQKHKLLTFLNEFSIRIKKITQDVEIPIFSELSVIQKELETVVSWNIPVVSFVPGDLNFFLMDT